MAKTRVVGEVEEVGQNGARVPRFVEALQAAADRAPRPGSGFDVQVLRLVSVEMQYGGFVPVTKTRVTLDVEDGMLPPLEATGARRTARRAAQPVRRRKR